MGRIGKLKEEAYKNLAKIKTGSHQKGVYRKRAVLNFIDALFSCKMVPTSCYGLTKIHILAVIQYWRKNKLKDDSIRMYLAELRAFLQAIGHSIEGIDNKTLGLTRAKEPEKIPFQIECLQKISEPIISLLLLLQIEFGLSRSEAFRFTPDLHVRQTQLLLSRDMTNNSSDRIVEIYSEEQKKLIRLAQSLIETNANPIKQYGYHGLRERYRKEIKKAGLSPSASYRPVFAAKRFNALLQAHEKSNAKSIVLAEMGISERILRRYLNEFY